MPVDNIKLVLITIIVINVRMIVVSVCKLLTRHKYNKKELTAQSDKRRG